MIGKILGNSWYTSDTSSFHPGAEGIQGNNWSDNNIIDAQPAWSNIPDWYTTVGKFGQTMLQVLKIIIGLIFFGIMIGLMNWLVITIILI